MLTFEEYDIKIADYFDNKMSLEEDQAFMEELGNNSGLRELFEEEMQRRAFFGALAADEKKTAGGNQAPAPLHAVKAAAVKGDRKPVVLVYRRLSTIAAAAVLIVAVIAIYLVLRKNEGKTNIVAGITTGKNTSKTKDSLNNLKLHQPNPTEIARNAFGKFYKKYPGQDIPVQLSQIGDQYKKGQYADVLKPTPADLLQMGADDNAGELNQYLQLYKGLAYLAQNSAAKAVVQFDTVLHTAPKTAPQYYAAQWYSALAALKLGLVNSADSTAGVMTKGASPYKAQAGKLHGYLSGNKVVP